MHNNASMPYMSLIIRRKWNHPAVRQARPVGQYVDLPRAKKLTRQLLPQNKG